MALGVADLAYVLDVGEVSLSGDAPRARPDRRGAAPLPRARRGAGASRRSSAVSGQDALAVDGVTAAPARRRGHRSDIPAVEVDNVSVRFGAIKALSRRLLHRRARHDPRHHRAQRRRQVDDVQRPLRASTRPPRAQVRFGEHRLDRMRPHQIAGIGVARAFQNIALSARPDRRREPHARPPPPDQGRLPRRRAAAAAATREGKLHGERVARDRRVPRARRQAAHARRRPVLRRPEAGRGRPGAVHRAAAAAARRAGGRHERRGDPPDGGGHPRDPGGARHLGRPRRARHGHGHGARRPGHRARLRTADRRRHPGRGAGATPRSSAPTSAPATRSTRPKPPPTTPPRPRGRTRDPVPVAAAQRRLARGRSTRSSPSAS